MATWSGPDISAVGSLISEPARMSMLAALLGGIALPAGELAAGADVTAATASFHLAKLVNAGWVSVERQGRHRYYRLRSNDVAELIERAARLAPANPPRSLRASRQRDALSEARTCYDHLAGRLGVELMRALLAQRLLRDGDDGLAITPRGRSVLMERGIDLDIVMAKRRQFVKSCLDWTERRQHLGGALGAAILEEWLQRGYLERGPAPRAVRITHGGHAGLAEWAIDCPPPSAATAS